MSEEKENYLTVNKQLWNERTAHHFDSKFYDVAGFKNGQSSLNSIELELLGNIADKKILHLQCHFGMDTISLARLGAQVTGVDLSDAAISQATKLAAETQSHAQFLLSDIYSLTAKHNEQYDIVFTSYGTIGWLPDLTKWAQVINHFLLPGGKFLLVEFHPLVWIFDNAFKYIQYSYFNKEAIVETEHGTYADKNAAIETTSITWNHPLSEVINSLIKCGLQIEVLQEYDYSPYNILPDMMETEKGRYQIASVGDKMPLVYAILATKPL
ncbi:MAG: class I SAM-dependent methyltransferase [Bacteroidetes bacterium]|nr:class I SAM-dependent methyltransferase [Bacteroidota bacterium]